MTDPRRSDRPHATADTSQRERDARVEDLLLAGLDHYFAGHYDLAISVWTRVLFLNHGHARARAYIERARTAIAERQREGDELLHTGVEAFGRGDGPAARQLLTSAVERGAANEEALALLERIDRLEMAMGPRHHAAESPPAANVTIREPRIVPVAGRPHRARWIALGVCTGALIAAAAVSVWLDGGEWSPFESTAAPAASMAPNDYPLPVPSASEAAIARARALYADGRSRDALAALHGIRPGDPRRAEADKLRAAIQRDLLAAARASRTSERSHEGRDQTVPR
jgi:hypothetical protein